MLQVVGVRKHLHQRQISQVARFVDVTLIHSKLEIIVVVVFGKVVVVVDKDALLCQIWAQLVKFHPEHRIFYRLAAIVVHTVEHRAKRLNLLCDTIFEAVELITLNCIETEHLVCRHVAILDDIFRIFLRASATGCIYDMESVEHLTHLYFILVGKHLASVKILVGRHLTVAHHPQDDAEQALLPVDRLVGIIERKVLRLRQVELTVDYAFPHLAGIAHLRLLIEVAHALRHASRCFVFLGSVGFARHLCPSLQRQAGEQSHCKYVSQFFHISTCFVVNF